MDEMRPLPSPDTKEPDSIDIVVACQKCGRPIRSSSDADSRFIEEDNGCRCAEPAPASSVGDRTVSLNLRTTEVPAVIDGRYDVVKQIGQGAMGSVFKVTDERLHKTFALKILRPELASDRLNVKRFEQEARAAKELTHPNLVPVYDYKVPDAGSPYMVMDFLDGESLSDLIKSQGYLDVPRALNIFIQICEGLEYAHQQGVIHRDVKPSNIILTKTSDSDEDFVKIVDFGIAKVLPIAGGETANLTQTGEVLGSPLYMSPEQCQGQKLDGRTDIYSLGCVMYEALTGKSPFAAENAVAIILRHLNEDPIDPCKISRGIDLPRSLSQVVLCALSRDVSYRYKTMYDLRRDLEAVRDGKPPRLLPLQSRVKAESSGRRSKILKVSAATILTVVLTCFALRSFQSLPFNPSQSSTPNSIADADSLDGKSAQYFYQKRYEEAIPLLQFGIVAYRKKGKIDTWLADMIQHLGKCYLEVGREAQSHNDPLKARECFSLAAHQYEEALKIYDPYGNYPGTGRIEALTDYASVLKLLGDTQNAARMEAEAKHPYDDSNRSRVAKY